MGRGEQFHRKDRFNRMLKEELSGLLKKEVRDPRLASVLISEVETTGDLRYSKIYYFIEGGLEDAAEVQKALERAGAFLRGRLGRELHIRFTPELTFVPDPSLDYAEHIDALLGDIQPGDDSDDSD